MLRRFLSRDHQAPGAMRPQLSIVRRQYRYNLPEDLDVIKADAVLFGLEMAYRFWLARPLYQSAYAIYEAAALLCQKTLQSRAEDGRLGTNDVQLYEETYIPLYKRAFRAMNDYLASSSDVFNTLCALSEDARLQVFRQYAGAHFNEVDAMPFTYTPGYPREGSR